MSISISTLDTKLRQILAAEEADDDIDKASRVDCIKEAVRSNYSQDAPRIVVVEVDGTGAFDYLLTTILTSYVEGFSVIQQVEYPVDDTSQEADIVDEGDWEVFRKSTGEYLRFKADTPSASEDFRVTYTAPYVFASSAASATIAAPETDLDAIGNLAASIAFGRMAARANRQSDPTIQADTTNYRDKSDRYRSLAKDYLARYRDLVGVSESGGPVPAYAVTDLDPDLQIQTPYLTHERRFR
jgi:hypothetical protein